MALRSFTCLGLCSGLFLFSNGGPRPAAQEDPSHFLVDVVLVQLNVAVTDHKGNYVSGLRPEDFVVTEDKIPQKIASFEEGSEARRRPLAILATPPDAAPVLPKAPVAVSPPPASLPDAAALGPVSRVSGASIFILFDTSNYMYRNFVFAQDAINGFVRSMDDVDKIAFYSYSRNLSRATTLTSDRYRVVDGVRTTVAGDDSALYNCLLLTVKDAAPLRGRKAIVVFSNGPDNASSVPPEDVAELAQSTGTIIYILSTRQAQQDPVSLAAFERVSRATGGKAYFAKNWLQEKQAFASIRDDLSHLYTLTYYPQANPNRGWRNIQVKLVGNDLQKYHVRSREGYRLRQQATVPGDTVSRADPAAP